MRSVIRAESLERTAPNFYGKSSPSKSAFVGSRHAASAESRSVSGRFECRVTFGTVLDAPTPVAITGEESRPEAQPLIEPHHRFHEALSDAAITQIGPDSQGPKNPKLPH